MTGPELKDLREDLGAAIGPAPVGRRHGKARRPRAGKRRGHLAQMEDSAGPSGPVATLMSICGSPAILSVRHRTCCGVMCLPAIARHTHARRQHRARNPRSAPRSRNASPRNTFLERKKSSKQTGYTLRKITQSSWRRKSPSSQRRKAMRRN